MIARRALLATLPIAAASPALALPEVDPAERVARLMSELADALDDYLGGSFRAIVDAKSRPDAQFILQRANLHLAQAEPSAELVRLIAAHTKVYDRLVEACTLSDELDPRYDPTFTGWKDANAAEEAARAAVLAAPCNSLADVRAKVAHLVRRIEAGDWDFPDPSDIEALLRSLLASQTNCRGREKTSVCELQTS